MQWNDPRDPGRSCDRARLPGGKMAPLGSQRSVRIEECRLDEELICALRQVHDFFDIRILERGIDHIGKLVSGCDSQGVLLQSAECSRL